MIEFVAAMLANYQVAHEPAASCSPEFMVLSTSEIPSILDAGVSVRLPHAPNETERTLSIVPLTDAFYILIHSDTGKVADAYLDTSTLGDRELSIFPSDVRASVEDDAMEMSIYFPIRSSAKSWPQILDRVYVHFDGTTWTADETSYNDDCRSVQRELQIGSREE